MTQTQPTRIAIGTLGCKLNQAETEILVQQLAAAGYIIVPSVEEADVYILNTCTVTHIADRKARHLLRQAHRLNSHARLVTVGCYADPDELGKIEGIGLVLGNEDKADLPERLAGLGLVANPSGLRYDGTRTRTFLKVQDGCHSFCAYCIVPFVRSNETSVPSQEVLAEIRSRVAEGYKEVVLTGTEIGSYCFDGVSLRGLLKQILAETDIERVRLSSLQPPEITPELIELWRNDRLCPHFHLSLQSGSDSVLARMKRQYNTGDYERAVALIREVVPEAAITTDVIIGFPGETDAEFQESYEFCQRMKFARIHVFGYSKRRGTAAATMPHQVPDKVKKERSREMLTLARESARSFHQNSVGKTMVVLWEQESNGVWSGYTGNYIKVYIKNDENLSNQLRAVKLEKIYRDGVGAL